MCRILFKIYKTKKLFLTNFSFTLTIITRYIYIFFFCSFYSLIVRFVDHFIFLSPSRITVVHVFFERSYIRHTFTDTCSKIHGFCTYFLEFCEDKYIKRNVFSMKKCLTINKCVQLL